MILLPKPYQEEYNFAMADKTVERQLRGVLLLSNRANIEDRKRVIGACALSILTAFVLSFVSPDFSCYALLDLSANLAIIVGAGFLYYRSRQPEYFEAKLPVAEVV